MQTTYLKIDYDIEKARRDLKDVETKRLPSVYAKSLSDTAKRLAEFVRIRTRAEFKLHTDFIPRGIWVKDAEKRDYLRYGFMNAVIYTAPIISHWMPIHEPGGAKSRRSGKYAIPGRDIERMPFKTATGKVKTSFRPSTLLAGMNATPRKPRRNGKPRIPSKAFIVRNHRGQSFIVQRQSTDRKDLKTLFVLDPIAKIEPRWNFVSTVERSAQHVMERLFRYNWDKYVEQGAHT